jgi:GT2 family glycosyltransferase
MLLNDDPVVQPGAIAAMVEFLDAHPEAGIVGAQLLNPDMTLQQCYDYAPNPWYDGLQPLSEILFPLPRANGKPLQVENVNGACMLVRGCEAEKIGYLDTRFDPLYSEEVDWCFRFRKAGWQIYHLPHARVIHLGGSTMNRVPAKRYERIFEKKALFFRKHYGKLTLAIYKVSLLLANLLKFLIWGLAWLLGQKNAGEKARIHLHMVRRALFL